MAFGAVLVVALFFLRRDVLAEHARLRKERSRWVTVLVSALFFLGLAVAVRVIGDDTVNPPQPPRPVSGQPATTGADGTAEQPYEPEFAPWAVLLVVAVAGGGLLAAYLAHRGRRQRLGDGDEPLALVLADVLDETVDDLRRERDPRRAVVAAYARLERVLGAYGLPRRPAEAPEEYLGRILADLDVGRLAVTRLTSLFEWAKFSQHEVDEGMKEQAIAALEAVREELRAAELRAAAERETALLEARERAAL
jgi:hypothetical protein